MTKTIHAAIVQLLLSALLFCTTDAFCQKYDPEILGTVDLLFNGMREGDSSMLRRAVLPTCTLTSISKNSADSIIIRKSEIADFIKAVGTPHSEKWDEQIFKTKISVDYAMAIVWAPYKFYLGEKFSHCGVNVFTLVQTRSGWKISNITDTRRKENCL